jgi:aminopeptidase-like protein
MMTYRPAEGTGAEMHALIAELYPICRSITGEGFRATLRRLAAIVPIVQTEVPTGTRVFDWTVPKEWNIRDAWIADGSGKRVVDFRASNLHVVNYSAPVRARMSLAELLRACTPWSSSPISSPTARAITPRTGASA